MQTGAGGCLFGIIALEGLDFQVVTFLDAAESRLFDDAVAAWIDVVHATTNIVVATDWNFLGRVGGWVMLAGDLVLEGSGAFHPRASELAFHSATFRLHAASSAHFGLVIDDGAFIDDVVLEIAFTIVDALAVLDATGSLDGILGTAGAGAVVPEFARFDGITSIVGFAVFHASGLDQSAAFIFVFFAHIEAIFFLGLFIDGDVFAGIDASLVDGDQLGFGASSVLLAGEEVFAIIPTASSRMFLAVLHTARDLEGQCIATGHTTATVVTVVVVSTDWEAGQIFGDASFGHDTTTLATVDQTAAFDFGSLGITTRASTGRTSSASRISRSGQDGGGPKRTGPQR